MPPVNENWPAWLESAGGELFPVVASCSMGRLNSNQIVLANEKVSRRHAIVHAQGENEYWLIDLGSSNGTFLNGQRVTKPTRLRDRDQIEIGPFRLTFGCASGASLATTLHASHTICENKRVLCWLLVTDIIGSTKLGQNLGPTDLSKTFGQWFDHCHQIIEDSRGSIDKYLGDGFFGFWRADAQSEEGMVTALQQFRALQDSATPPFRLVLHFGSVFWGGLATMGEARLFGPEVNFAFRMERLAARLKKTALVSSPVAGKIREKLALAELGQHDLPGFEGRFGFYGF